MLGKGAWVLGHDTVELVILVWMTSKSWARQRARPKISASMWMMPWERCWGEFSLVLNPRFLPYKRTRVAFPPPIIPPTPVAVAVCICTPSDKLVWCVQDDGQLREKSPSH